MIQHSIGNLVILSVDGFLLLLIQTNVKHEAWACCSFLMNCKINVNFNINMVYIIIAKLQIYRLALHLYFYHCC